MVQECLQDVFIEGSFIHQITSRGKGWLVVCKSTCEQHLSHPSLMKNKHAFPPQTLVLSCLRSRDATWKVQPVLRRSGGEWSTWRRVLLQSVLLNFWWPPFPLLPPHPLLLPPPEAHIIHRCLRELRSLGAVGEEMKRENQNSWRLSSFCFTSALTSPSWVLRRPW